MGINVMLCPIIALGAFALVFWLVHRAHAKLRAKLDADDVRVQASLARHARGQD